MIKTVNVEGLNFRKGPTMNHNIIRVLAKGEKVDVVNDIYGWSNIIYKNENGYVASKYLIEEKEEKKKIKVVNVDGLNFRKGPNINYSIIKVLTKGQEVEFINENNGWSKIIHENKQGYVASKYLDDKSIVDDIAISDIIKKAIDIAKSKLNCKYSWGADGPNVFDCSGFIYYIFKKQLEINVPRVSKDQSNYGKLVDRDKLKPGDLIFFDTEGINDFNVSHVGMYIGNNEFIHAASGTTMKVIISKLEGYYSKQYVKARRLF